MRIFVAFGYNPRDEWIQEMVFPIIEAFGSSVVTGEKTYGDSITDAVRARIYTCEALIGFLTRRSPEAGGDGQASKVLKSLRSVFPGGNRKNTAGNPSHRWVIEEIAIAHAQRIKVVEVREQGVDPQSGIVQSYQRIDYDEKDRETCLIKIVEALGSLHQGALVKIQLLPTALATQQILPLLKKPNKPLCNYIIKRGNTEGEPVVTTISGERGGIFITAPKVTGTDLLQVNITYGELSWSSLFEATDYYLELRPSQGNDLTE